MSRKTLEKVGSVWQLRLGLSRFGFLLTKSFSTASDVQAQYNTDGCRVLISMRCTSYRSCRHGLGRSQMIEALGYMKRSTKQKSFNSL